MPLIAPSILSADFTQLGNEIRAVEKGTGAVKHVKICTRCLRSGVVQKAS